MTIRVTFYVQLFIRVNGGHGDCEASGQMGRKREKMDEREGEKKKYLGEWERRGKKERSLRERKS